MDPEKYANFLSKLLQALHHGNLTFHKGSRALLCRIMSRLNSKFVKNFLEASAGSRLTCDLDAAVKSVDGNDLMEKAKLFGLNLLKLVELIHDT